MSAFRIEGLNDRHDVSVFSSGEPTLDDWLRRYALVNQAVHSSRTFVLTEGDSPQVWGYYSLTVSTIERQRSTKSGRSRMPQAYDIPAVLLARLARDEKRRSERLGDLLLADAVLRTLAIADQAGIRLLAVHALNDRARTWYLQHDFQQSPIDDRLLMLTVPDLIATMESLE